MGAGGFGLPVAVRAVSRHGAAHAVARAHDLRQAVPRVRRRGGGAPGQVSPFLRGLQGGGANRAGGSRARPHSSRRRRRSQASRGGQGERRARRVGDRRPLRSASGHPPPVPRARRGPPLLHCSHHVYGGRARLQARAPDAGVGGDERVGRRARRGAPGARRSRLRTGRDPRGTCRARHTGQRGGRLALLRSPQHHAKKRPRTRPNRIAPTS